MADVTKRLYEGMFLVDAATATAEWDEVVGAVQKIFDRADAEVQTLKKWDERRLMYEIEGRKRGTYILTYFNAPPEKIAGLERDVQLNETLLRVLVLRADEIPQEIREAPTPAETGHRTGEGEEGEDRFGDRDRGFGGRDRDRSFGGDRDRDRDRGFGGDRDRERSPRRPAREPEGGETGGGESGGGEA